MDGGNWVPRVDIPRFLWGITYGGGRFVAVGTQVILSSADGIDWTVHEFEPGISVSFNAVAYGAGHYAAVGPSDEIYISPDAVLNDDGIVDRLDLGIMMSYWGQSDAEWADLDRDGSIGQSDMSLLRGEMSN